MAKNYGLHIIIGDNGMGKTFYTHMFRIYDIWWRLKKAIFRTESKRRTIRIGNYTSPDFDIIFKSRDDLLKILVRLIATKLNPVNDYIDYVITIDEVHKYFSNRDFKNFPQLVTDFLSEVRKMDTLVYGLTPRFLLIDTTFRRMSYTVRQYCMKWRIFRYIKDYRLIREDSSVLEDETVAEKLGAFPQFPIWFVAYFLRLYTKHTRRYDTKEIIFTGISILGKYSKEHLDACFPEPIYLEDADDVFEYLQMKLALFEKEENKKEGFSPLQRLVKVFWKEKKQEELKEETP